VTALLTIASLGGGYGALPIFRNVAFTVEQGQTIGILGPNGAGKTTLLKTIAGLLPAQQGAIRLDGLELQAQRGHARARLGLCLVPEGRQIFATMSVRENLDLSAAAARFTPAQFKTALEEVLALFPRLAERLDQMGGSLSGGEQQMLAISRALLLNPRVLLLDEPTQGLAPIMIQQVMTALKALRGRIAMVVVEQNRDFLKQVTDDIFTMTAGVLSAPPQTAKEQTHD